MMLFYGEGYSIKEIAKALSIPVSTVQTRLARGRKKLAEYVECGRE
jgi:RNA polymerase sigma-70 factor (ECF subfamily)